MNNITNSKSSIAVWVCLVVILMSALFLRLAGIWRTEPIDYHPDEWVIAEPVMSIANNAEVGLKTHYKWPACGLIYSIGYSMYALRGLFGPYSYNGILILLRVISATVGTAVVLFAFLVMRKLFSVRTGLLAAALLAVTKLPVCIDHAGAVRSMTALIILMVMLLSYDLFDLRGTNGGLRLKTGRCCLLGLIWGFGISIKWTALLAVIPFSGAFLLSVWHHRESGDWPSLFRLNLQRVMIIASLALLGFLAGNPDFTLAPRKVISSFTYEMKHNVTGHYGTITNDRGIVISRLPRTIKVLSNGGSIYVFVPAIAAVIFCFLRPSRARVFLLWVMLIWLVILVRNLMAPERHHLVPFIMMLLITSVAFDALFDSQNSWLRITGGFIYAFMVIMACLYSLIYISPSWKPDARIQCSKWIEANVPLGSGITWAPRTHKWMLPGMVIAPELFDMYPREAQPGRDQYILAAHRVMRTFRDHPPDRPINPDDWFPSKPPTMSELIIYAEMNAGGGPHLEFIREFKTKPQFLGLDLRLFGQSPDTDTIIANQAVSLFKLKRIPGPEIGK